MAGLLTPNPNFSWGAFGGDALAGLGQGLLAYGAGGQLRQQAPLIAIQGMQQAQQAQAEQQQRALQTQSLTQQLAMQQQQMSRQAAADDAAARQKQQYLGLLGGQPIQGPTPSGAPLDIKSPVNPALANLPPAMRSMLPLMDPSQGMGMIAQASTREAKAPTTVGGMQYDAAQNKFVPIPGYTEQAQAIAQAGRPPQQPIDQWSPYSDPKTGRTGQRDAKTGKVDWDPPAQTQMVQTGVDANNQPIYTFQPVSGAKITNEQATAGTRATMIKDGVTKMVSLYNSPDISLWRQGAAKLGDKLDPDIGNSIRTGAEQEWQAARSAALEGLASAVTGAGVAKEQFGRYENMLPAITDKDPKVKAFKLKLANDFLKQQLIAAGPAGKDLAGAIDDGTAAGLTQQAAPPASAPTKELTYNPTTKRIE